jgi:VWFA-related protein
MSRWPVAVLLALGSVAAAAPQEPVTGRVPLRIIATDARGRDVKGLSASDLEITEGAQALEIESLTTGTGPRKIGILLDEYHVSEGTPSARVSAALLRFIERSVREDDVVFVMKPLDPASTLAPVPGRDALREIVTRFAGRKGDYTPRSAFEAEYMSSAPPSATRQRAQVSRAAMQALVMALTRVEPTGPTVPSALIVMTEGFASEDRGRDRLTTIRMVARAARLSNVAVYVLDPSTEARSASPFNQQWQSLVAQTGGVLTTGAAPLEPALGRLAADLDSHYVATIAPSYREDGAYHPIEVKVKRREVSVRAPAGYWTPIAAERYTAPSRPPMSTYLKTPHISGLIQPWFRVSRAPGGRTEVTFSWAPRRTATLQAADVTFSAVTFEGVHLHQATVRPQGDGDAAAVFLSAPGAIQVSMEIRDQTGKYLDTEVRYIDVPRLDAAGAMITAVEVLRTRTLREFLERQTQPHVMPSDIRSFYRDDRLIVRVRALARSDDPPSVRARLLNTRGQLIRELVALPPIDGVPQFDLPLAPFPRGDYHIEVRATDGSSTVSQLVSFRLIG